jgi:phospholipid-transporting ATPase
MEIVFSYSESTNTSARRMYYPKQYHYVQEIQKFNVADYRPRYSLSRSHANFRMEQFQKAIRKVRQVQRMRKQRGYAFSQGDEGQMRLIRAYDTTQHRGKYGEMKAAPHGEQQNRGLGGYI